MFLRRTQRRKDGKTHHYWNIVENRRLDEGHVVQRQVLSLGEINSSQAAAWRKAIEVFDTDAGSGQTLALFTEDRCEAVADDAAVVRLRLSALRLCRPRQWGACWLAGLLWRDLGLDQTPRRMGPPFGSLVNFGPAALAVRIAFRRNQTSRQGDALVRSEKEGAQCRPCRG